MRAELDALFFHLYGINRDDVDYIMETFPIVKRKDVAEHGTYRNKGRILEICDRLAERDGGPLPKRPDGVPPVPRPRPAPDDGPPPPPRPRPARPPLPRRPRSHRKPRPHRPRAWWHLLGYTLATLAGALAGAPAHHLIPFLL